MGVAETVNRCGATPSQLVDVCANKVFSFSLLLVLTIKLYPYILFKELASSFGSQSLFSGFGEHLRLAEILANFLLFVPLGFGFTCLAQKRKLGKRATLVIILLASSGLSLILEALQIFLPFRSASLSDILANSAGALLGFLYFRLWGIRILAQISSIARKCSLLLSVKSLPANLLGYGALAILISVPVLRSTGLGNWDNSFPLILGNEQTGDRPWRGKIFRVEIANRAIPKGMARVSFENSLSDLMGDALVVSYHFTNGGSYQDLAGKLPALSWKGQTPGRENGSGIILPGKAWLETIGPAIPLAEKVQETNQFTLNVICAPANTTQSGPARIVSFSSDTTHRNFTLGQQGKDLVFRLHTPLTGQNGTEPQLIVPGIFGTTERRNLVITYDGLEISLFVDGVRHSHSLDLSPGVFYYGLVFIPLGCLLACTARKQASPLASKIVLVAGGVSLPSVALQGIPMSVGGRPADVENLLLGVFFAAGTALLAYYYRRE